MRPCRAPAIFLCGLISGLLLGCDASTEPAPTSPGAPSTANPAANSTANSSGDPSFPWPELTDVEPEVREHLESTRGTLESTLRVEGSPTSPAHAYGEAGIVYHGYSLRSAALEAYRRAEAGEPLVARWPYLRGHVLRTGDDMTAAVDAFRRALELEPTLVAGWISLGDALFELDRTEEARAAFTRALDLAPLTSAAHAGLGRVLLEERDFAAAARSLEEALRLAPQASAYRYPLGLAYRGLGDDARALEQMEQRGMLHAPPPDPYLTAVREAPTGWRVHLRRGTSLFTEGRFTAALDEFERAAQSAPDVATVRLNLGSALVRCGRPDEAVPHFEAAAQLDPAAPLPWFNLGVLAGRRGDDARAVAYYERATDADPGLVDADFNRGNALRRLGDFDGAAVAYARVVAHAPSRMEARLGEALAVVRRGDLDRALERLEAAHAIDATHRGTRNALARLLAIGPDPRDPGRAVTLANALVAEESSLEHVETVAMAYAGIGRSDIAVDLQDKAIAAAREAGMSDTVETLEANRALYTEGRPAPRAWPIDSPVLAPPALTTPQGASPAPHDRGE